MFKNNDLLKTENQWENVYWFSRILISNDKYGAPGKKNDLLEELIDSLKTLLNDEKKKPPKLLDESKETIKKLIDKKFIRAKSKKERIRLFYNDLFKRLKNIDDVNVFIITLEYIMLPINKAMEKVPNNDREFTLPLAEEFLNRMGSDGLATVINFWDDIGVEGCLKEERKILTKEFTKIRESTDSLKITDSNQILTAFVQEFERRLGQKRKGRAGGSLEDVTTFLFDYFNIHSVKGPEHFQADIEVDKWIKCKDKWLIGISCKRTLRERWKQVSSADATLLSRFKIRQIWHIITYDEDLSDDKITLLGGQRHVFYLRDDSRILSRAISHEGMESYVKPISRLINDIRELQK